MAPNYFWRCITLADSSYKVPCESIIDLDFLAKLNIPMQLISNPETKASILQQVLPFSIVLT